MAQVTNTVSSYDMEGKQLREDLRDVIYDVSVRATPFISMIGRGEANNRAHQWTTDALRAAATNANIEGDETTFAAFTMPTRQTNYTQIFKEAFVVSGTAQAVNTVGSQNEAARLKVKTALQVRRDMESAFVGNQAPASGDDSTARVARPLEGWISTNASRGSGGSAGTASAAATDGSLRDFQSGLIDEVMEDVVTNSGEVPTVLMCHPSMRKNINNMSIGSNVQRQQMVNNGKLATAIKVVETSFGDLDVVDNYLMRTRTVAIVNPEYWEVAVLPGRDFVVEQLAKTGDADKWQVLAEATLVSKNEAANAIVADLNA